MHDGGGGVDNDDGEGSMGLRSVSSRELRVDRAGGAQAVPLPTPHRRPPSNPASRAPSLSDSGGGGGGGLTRSNGSPGATAAAGPPPAQAQARKGGGAAAGGSAGGGAGAAELPGWRSSVDGSGAAASGASLGGQEGVGDAGGSSGPVAAAAPGQQPPASLPGVVIEQGRG